MARQGHSNGQELMHYIMTAKDHFHGLPVPIHSMSYKANHLLGFRALYQAHVFYLWIFNISI